jgi:hypothetical protein
MDNETRAYRKGQIAPILDTKDVYGLSIRLATGNCHTNYLAVDDDELKAIVRILTVRTK